MAKSTGFYRDVRAVIFALGDTIFYEASRLGAFMGAVFHAIGRDAPADDFRQFAGLSREATIDLLRERFGQEIDAERVWDAYSRAFKRRREIYGINLRPGVRELLAYLRETNRKAAVSTNLRREDAEEMLKAVGLLESNGSPVFDAIVCVDDEEVKLRPKPQPILHIKTCEQLSMHPVGCLALEDCYGGVQGALQAGLRAALVTGGRSSLSPNANGNGGAYLTVETLLEVLQSLKEEDLR